MLAPAGSPPVTWGRQTAIASLRRCLNRLCDGEHSTCQVAAERGIFCRGFRRWNDHEFHQRWKTVLGESTHLTRPQIERLADLWQLSEQIAQGVRVTCDAQSGAPGPCRGWQEFSNETLARFCAELLGREVVVVIDENASVACEPFREIRDKTIDVESRKMKPYGLFTLMSPIRSDGFPDEEVAS